ncbi:MAG: hypothetical protein ACP5D7_15470 [Limnospira sp.]
MSDRQIPAKGDENQNRGGEYLSLLGGVAILLVLTRTAFPLILAIASGTGIWLLWQSVRRRQEYLDRVFYRQIRERGGRITPLDLALETGLPASQVQSYLDRQAVEFSARFEVTEDGGIVYTFSTAETQAAVPEPGDTAETVVPFSNSPRRRLELPTVPLNQTELAKRFEIHPNTVSRWKRQPEFRHWSAQKDPDAIAWKYSEETRQFYPEPKQTIAELMERNRLGN